MRPIQIVSPVMVFLARMFGEHVVTEQWSGVHGKPNYLVEYHWRGKYYGAWFVRRHK